MDQIFYPKINRKYKKFDGELIALYGVLYGAMRFIAEFWRQPDVQLGFLYDNWLTMGQIQGFVMIIISMGIYIFLWRKSKSY